MGTLALIQEDRRKLDRIMSWQGLRRISWFRYDCRPKELTVTQYFLTLPHDSAEEPTMESMKDLDPTELEAVFAAVDEFNTALKDSRALRFAGGLNPPSSAKTVDASTGRAVVTDGPFVEAPEYVGGFWVIEADDEATAVEWAARASTALQSRIEVRALQERPQD
jgi:hypothetical protein